jgi:drug/metabolite transporter (DMT)-like permease
MRLRSVAALAGRGALLGLSYVGVLWGAALLGEALTPVSVVGMVLVVAGLALVLRGDRDDGARLDGGDAGGVDADALAVERERA